MDPLIEGYLETSVPPGRASLIRRSMKSLSDIESLNHVDSIYTLLSISDDVEVDELTKRIEETVLTSIDDEVGEYGVGFNELRIENASHILDALINLEYYDDLDAILEICEGDGNSDEKFAEIVHLITDADVMEILEVLSHVTPSLIARIEEIVTTQKEIEDAMLVAQEKTSFNNVKFLSLFLKKHPTAKLTELLKDGWEVGYKASTYHEETLSPDDSDYRVIAINYMAGMLAAGYEPTEAANQSSSILEHLYEDSHFLQRVVSYVNGFLDGDFNETS